MAANLEPESVTLYYRGRNDFLWFLIGSGLLLFGTLGRVYGFFDVDSLRFVVFMVFAVIITISFLLSWLLSHLYYIGTEPAGLTTRFLPGTKRYQWNEIRNVKVLKKTYKGITNKWVVFDLSPYSEAYSLWNNLSKLIGGHHVIIRNGFRRSPEQIVELLNSWIEWRASQEGERMQSTDLSIADRLKQWQLQYGQGNQPPTST